jgi:hypothetical protein
LCSKSPDNVVAPNDVLEIINWINANPRAGNTLAIAGESEGESAAIPAAAAQPIAVMHQAMAVAGTRTSPAGFEELLTLLAADSQIGRGRRRR